MLVKSAINSSRFGVLLSSSLRPSSALTQVNPLYFKKSTNSPQLVNTNIKFFSNRSTGLYSNMARRGLITNPVPKPTGVIQSPKGLVDANGMPLLQKKAQIIDTDALYEELRAKGPFPKNEKGILDPEIVLKLKLVMSKHSYLNFVPFKDQMMKERFADLKAGNQAAYKEKVIQASQKAAEIQTEVTKLSCARVGLTEADYGMSMGAAVQNPQFRQKMQRDEQGVRVSCEQVREEPLTKE